MKAKTIPVSKRALIARINRKLRPENQKLCASRGGSAKSNLGDYHIINFRRNEVVDSRFDLEALGRKLEVLAEYERLED